MFLWISEIVTLRDTFSYMHSMLSIDFIDVITSKTKLAWNIEKSIDNCVKFKIPGSSEPWYGVRNNIMSSHIKIKISYRSFIQIHTNNYLRFKYAILVAGSGVLEVRSCQGELQCRGGSKRSNIQ